MIDGHNDINSATPKGFRLGFGIFMVFFYVAIGIVFLMNLFKITEGISIAVGCLLIVYGIWRGYRLIRAVKE